MYTMKLISPFLVVARLMVLKVNKFLQLPNANQT